MSRRFDAEGDAFIDEAHSYDVAERDGYFGDETLFYLTDDQSNGRWLYVDHPDGEDGNIQVGIARTYRKHLSPAAARAMAQALLLAADESDAAKPEREARRVARRTDSLILHTSGYTTSTAFLFGGGSR